MAHPERPRHREAYREYLKLGLRRSIPALHDRLEELWVIGVPTVGTLATWCSQFGWNQRVIEDDEIINRRALDRLRERLANEVEVRRERRLHLADIQLNAAMRAMVTEQIDRDTGEKRQVPIDLLKTDPSSIRAINDTIRLAAETQRLDLGEATSRIAGQESAQEHAVRSVSPEEMNEDLMRFVSVSTDDGFVTVPEPLLLPPPESDEQRDVG